jgi:phosphatidylinositol-3-phosphatase
MRNPRLFATTVAALFASSLLIGSPAMAAHSAQSSGADPASVAVLHPTKVLTFVEENHTYDQMKSGMPYLWSQAQKYAYATNYKAITHPSLPNYLAIASGSTFGINDDKYPSSHLLKAGTVFDQALAAGKSARLYNESMPSNCSLNSSGAYAVKHNPWAYFTPGRTSCGRFDVSTGSLLNDAKSNSLPNVGMVVPNLNNDAHDGSLSTADSWLKQRLPTILASTDFTSGRLAVVITADEGSSSNNTVLTVVLDANLSGAVVTAPLTHYSLTRFYAQTIGVTPLLAGRTAPDMRAAFKL